jgi:hypothetical protein
MPTSLGAWPFNLRAGYGLKTNWMVLLAAMVAPDLVRAGLNRHSRAAF